MHTLHPVAVLSFAAATLTAQWQQLSPTTTGPSPTARAAFGMACKVASGDVVLFAGTTGVSFGPQSTITLMSNQTWRLTGDTWTQLTPVASPSPRFGVDLVHDAARDRFVTYGGCTTSGLIATMNSQTWEFDGTTWTQAVTAVNPGPRLYAALSYDPVRTRTVLYGGRTSHFGGVLASTWEFDGAAWHEIVTAQGPGARERTSMCYHPSLGQTLLFGGYRTIPSGTGTQFAPDDETWLFDGAFWTLVPVTGPRPAPRIGAKLVFDTTRGVAVLFGGMDGNTGQHLGDTWQFDGAWTQVGSTATASREHGMVFEPTRRLVMRFGGTTGGNDVSDETWSFGARADAVGAGCAGTSGVPFLDALTAPRLGHSYSLLLSNLVPSAPLAIVALGLATTTVPLAGIGMPGCMAHVVPDVLAVQPAAAGTATWSAAIPAQTALLGVTLVAQGLSFDAAANALGLTASNGVTGLLGF
jgi:hypothetical protein